MPRAGTLGGVMIKHNSVKCAKCEDILVSKKKNERELCSCRAIFIGGGLSQFIRGGDFNSMIELSDPIPHNLYINHKKGEDVMSQSPSRKQRRDLPDAIKQELCEKVANGASRDAMAKKYDVTRNTVNRLMQRFESGEPWNKRGKQGKARPISPSPNNRASSDNKLAQLSQYIEGLQEARKMLGSPDSDEFKGWDKFAKMVLAKIHELG